MSIDSKYVNRKYEVVAYDQQWPELFRSEAEKLRMVFRDDARAIEHVGSTAVPELPSKPTIDILILVDDISVADRYAAGMESLGYLDLGDYLKKGSHLFAKERPGNADRLFNVHVFPVNHQHSQNMLRLRDYLRANPEEVTGYAKLKWELAERYPGDYGQYRKYKDEYVKNLLERAISNSGAIT